MLYQKAGDNIIQNKIVLLGNQIREADAVVIGAGAGLSAAAGMTYTGQRFIKYFSDFIDKYHFPDMYSGGFYPFPSIEEHWAYWSRYIDINRYQDGIGTVYQDLLDIVKDKSYFVITTNVDHCFQKAGLDKARLFYTQGDYGLFQCPTPCHNKTYDNEQVIHQMVSTQKDMRIPSGLIPYCPVCGKPMTMNLRCDNSFVQDEGWYHAQERYQSFLREHQNEKMLFLELGVGSNTPVIIKYPFWRMTHQNPKAFFASLNLCEAYAPPEIADRSICLEDDIKSLLIQIKERI